MTEPRKMKFEDVERILRKRPGGDALADALGAHVEEVMELVTRNSRVAVVWQRNHGPDFVRAAIESIRSETAFPGAVGGVSVELLLLRMADALQRHGSPALRCAIADHSFQVLSWAREHVADTDLRRELDHQFARVADHG